MSILHRRHMDEWEEHNPDTVVIKREELLKKLSSASEAENESTEGELRTDFSGKLSLLKKLTAKNVLVIDITTDKLYYLIVKRSGEEIEVKKWGSEDLTAEETDRYRSIEFALKYIKSQYYRAGMSVFVSFFSPDVNIRQVVVPKLKPVDLKKTILYKNKSEIPNFSDDVWWDYQILETFRENEIEKVRALVAVVPSEVVDIHMDLLTRSGFKPDILLPRPFALQSFYKAIVVNPLNDVLVDIGNDVTQICFFVDGKLRFVRNFAIGMNNLEVAIKSGNGNGNGKPIIQEVLPADSSEQKTPVSGENLRERLLKKVEALKSKQNPLLQVLLGEILRSLEFFRGPKDEYPINRVYVSGSGLKLDVVYTYLKQRLHYPVEMVAPCFTPQNNSWGEYGEYVSAVGLSLYSGKHMNMIPSEFRSRELFKNLNIFLSVLIFMGVLGAGFTTYHLRQELNSLDERYQVLQKKYEELNPTERIYQEFVKKIASLKKQKNHLLAPVVYEPRLLEVMKIFSNEVPKEIRLTSLGFFRYEAKKSRYRKKEEKPENYDYRINFTGIIQGDFVMGDVRLINFLNRLNNLKYFKKIKIIEKRKNPEKQMFEFEVEAYL